MSTPNAMPSKIVPAKAPVRKPRKPRPIRNTAMADAVKKAGLK